jgi:peptide/nickel transport system permease protein
MSTTKYGKYISREPLRAIGTQPPTASWGSMVNDGYKYLLKTPVLSIAPGAAILLIVFAFNMVGDGLRDALDPRLRGAL